MRPHIVCCLKISTEILIQEFVAYFSKQKKYAMVEYEFNDAPQKKLEHV